jgi:hypothetical protein
MVWKTVIGCASEDEQQIYAQQHMFILLKFSEISGKGALFPC